MRESSQVIKTNSLANKVVCSALFCTMHVFTPRLWSRSEQLRAGGSAPPGTDAVSAAMLVCLLACVVTKVAAVYVSSMSLF